VSDKATGVNSDAVAYATLIYANSTELVNGEKGKGNFKPEKLERDAGKMRKFDYSGSRLQQ